MSYKSPPDFFKLLITDAMLQQVVDQTILFAQQHIESQELPPRSRVHQWNSAPHTISELRKFLALLTAMGIVSYPRVEDAWVMTWPIASSSFSGIMSRDRFSLVMRFLHLNDSTRYIPTGQPGHDPLYKIRPFLMLLLENCKTAYTLRWEISVDKSMIAFKGRLSFIQYLPNKTAPTTLTQLHRSRILSQGYSSRIAKWSVWAKVEDESLRPHRLGVRINLQLVAVNW